VTCGPGYALLNIFQRTQHDGHAFADAVEEGVLFSGLNSSRVIIQGEGMGGTQTQGGNSEDARAATQVDYIFTTMNAILEQFEAQACGGVSAGAESHAGLDAQKDLITAGNFFVHPGRDDDQSLTDLEGLEVLLPGEHPILIGDGGIGGRGQVLNLTEVPEGFLDLEFAAFKGIIGQ